MDAKRRQQTIMEKVQILYSPEAVHSNGQDVDERVPMLTDQREFLGINYGGRMEDVNGSDIGCFGVGKNDKSSPNSKTADSKTGSIGTYYSSMDYTNPNFQDSTCDLKKDGVLEKAARKQSFVGEIKLYRKRYLILFLASFFSMMNAVPQFQYTVVADIVSCYYGVSLNQINLTCLVFMGVFIPLVFPVMFFMDKKGLRNTVLVGGLLNCIGGWIQCASFATDRYPVIMVSQTVYAVGQVFLLSLPPFIAGVWFGANEVGLACALGVFGNQLGYALGFIIPPMLLDNNCTHQRDISQELGIIGYPIAVINTVMLVVTLFAFEEKPKLFPSVAQAAKMQSSEAVDYTQSLKNLFKSVPFVLLLIAYGLITGTYFAMSTILNEMVLEHFPGAEVDAGWMGAMMVFTGMAGSILLGSVLDRTHRFKEISIAAVGIGFVLTSVYAILIELDEALWVQFVLFGLIGFFTAGYLPAGFDFAAEITYPEPEAMSGSLMNASCQMFSIIITFAASKLIQDYGDTASNFFFCACLLLGIIVTASIKVQLKRTLAF